MLKILHKARKFAGNHIKVITALIVGLVIGSGSLAAVYASIPDSGGIIHACYRSSGLASNGQVRIINTPGQSCNNNETAVSWNSVTPGQFLTNLVGADFTNTSLAYRNFANTDMHDAIFDQTALQGVDLRSANLTNATFRSSLNLNNTNLTDANFSSSNWGQATVTGVTLGKLS